MGEDMELRNIITFVRIAELQNFSKAAQQLGYSQSAVTMQIKQLEGELNAQLFERIGKHTKLTQAGSRLLPYALAVLDAVRQAEDITRERGMLTGSLRIGTASSLLQGVLPPVLVEFNRLCPAVQLSTHTAPLAELFEMVRQNEVDLLYFLDQRTNFSDWVKVAERKEPVYFVASAQSPLARMQTVLLEQLVEEPFLLPEKTSSFRFRMEQVLAQYGFALHPVLETNNIDILLQLLRQNRGVSFLPEFLVQSDLQSGNLVALRTQCPEIGVWSQLVYHRGKCVTPQMEQFLQLMVQLFQ